MSAPATALRGAGVRVAVAHDLYAIAALTALAALALAATWGTWGDLDSDTGYDAVAGARVAGGELPYRDFVYYYGPLAPLLSGAAAWLGGAGVGPSVALGLAITAAILAATYALARIVAGTAGALLATALTAGVALIPDNYGFVLPHTHAATLGTLAVLLAVLAAWRYAGTERVRWLVAAGACAGLAALTKPEPALAALAAGVAWLVLRRRDGGRPRELALFLAPALAIPVAVYGAFATAVPPRVLAFDNLYPVDELGAGGDALLRTRMPMTLESAAVVGGKLALYAAGALALALLARAIERPGRLRRPLVAAVALGAALIVAGALAKPDGVRDALYYAYGWIPAGAIVAVVVLVLRFRRRQAPWSASAQAQLAAAVALAVLAATTYGAFVFGGWRPQMAVYYAPLAAILLARLHLVELARSRAAFALGAGWVAFLAAVAVGLALKDARAESATVRGPGGALAETPAEAALYGQALDVIAARTRPGEPILVAPLMTGLYVLSGHPSPLPELSLLPSALPSKRAQGVAIARLDAAGVRLVITDRRTWRGYDQTRFGASFHRELAGWLQRDFDRIRTLRGDASRALDIWIRRTR